MPPEDFYQMVVELPKIRFLHTPSFAGMHYTDDLIILDVSFIQGRPKETRLALLKDINTRVAAAAGVSPDDMMITLYEVPGENISFGQGEAQRANLPAEIVMPAQDMVDAAVARLDQGDIVSIPSLPDKGEWDAAEWYALETALGAASGRLSSAAPARRYDIRHPETAAT